MKLQLRDRSVLLVFCTVLILASSVLATEQIPLKQAPITKYTPAPGQPERAGFVPPAVDVGPRRILPPPGAPDAKDLPARYDCREQGYVTSVKNQGACGACYAFSAAGNFESVILLDGGGTLDLSENNIKDCEYYGSGCDGGNAMRVANHASRNGMVLESCDPYDPAVVACDAGCSVIYNALGWAAICGATVPSAAILKQYINDFGPLQTTLYVGDGTDTTWRQTFNDYDDNLNSDPLYYADDSHAVNHAVLIVGWDDTIAHAGGTGCWIVKNSWGTSWGNTCDYGAERGYFYIAYGSANIGEYSSYFHEFMPVQEDVDLLSYDEGGYSVAYGASSTIFWGMAKFTASEASYLHRIEFWTTDVTDDIDIYIYDNFNGMSLSTLLATKTNLSYTTEGYHSAALTTPLELTASQDIYVAICFNNDSILYPLAADSAGPTESNTTYYSTNGVTFSDLGAAASVDAAIRIRISPYPQLSVERPPVEPDGRHEDLPSGYQLHDAVPNPFNPNTTIGYSLPNATWVEITIYDLDGNLVRSLIARQEVAGTHTEIWNGKDNQGRSVPAGIYCYRIETDDFVQAKKMALLK